MSATDRPKTIAGLGAAAVALASASAIASASQAQSVPSAVVSLSASDNYPLSPASDSSDTPGLVKVPNGTYAKLLLSPDPTLTAVATGPYVPGGSTSASVDLVYYFEIVGVKAGQVVPVDLSYYVTAFSGGQSYGQVYISMRGDVVTGIVGGTILNAQNDSLGEQESGDLTERVLDDVAYPVELNITVNSVDGSVGSGTIDPILLIDPSFTAIDPNYMTDYSIVISQSVGNTAAVPEPEIWAMMLIGFGGAGVALRRRGSPRVAA